MLVLGFEGASKSLAFLSLIDPEVAEVRCRCEGEEEDFSVSAYRVRVCPGNLRRGRRARCVGAAVFRTSSPSLPIYPCL